MNDMTHDQSMIREPKIGALVAALSAARLQSIYALKVLHLLHDAPNISMPESIRILLASTIEELETSLREDRPW